MPKLLRVKVVGSLSIRTGKAADLFAVSTVWPKHLTSQVFLSTHYETAFNQPVRLNAQRRLDIFNLLERTFYTSSTRPMTNNNLIKGF
jgi:hypothetical protein